MSRKIMFGMSGFVLIIQLFFFSFASASSAPIVNLEQPSENGIVGTTTVVFKGSASDDVGLLSATLYYGKVTQTENVYSEDGQIINETHDTQIVADTPSTNYGAAGEINIDGQTPHSHALLKFPNIIGTSTGQIAPGSNISSASLVISCFDAGNSMTAYMLKEDWSESEATWSERKTGVPWSNLGADGLSSRDSSGLTLSCSSVGEKTLDITAFVQSWLNGTPNYGIVLIESGTDGVDFYTSEHSTSANRPKLKVSFENIEGWGPKQTVSLNGHTSPVEFSSLLEDQVTYKWNIEVEDTESLKANALLNGTFDVNTNYAPKTRVIFISVDGLRPDAITTLGKVALPNFYKFKEEGITTDNARTDYDYTITLPNHSTMATARRVTTSAGHNWVTNSDPLAGQTLHTNKGSYISSVFDVVHDNGMSTALYASKSKFSLFDTSYNAANGAADTIGADDGRDKIDSYAFIADTAALTDAFKDDMSSNLYTYSFLHYADPDNAGHANGWSLSSGSSYLNAVKHVDTQLGELFTFIESNQYLKDNTIVILTADHGGEGTGHSDSNLPEDYTIPFYVWGKNVVQNTDLYALNSPSRQDPSTSRPDYNVSLQPIRNGDASNLALSLLSLPAIPGGMINSNQDLNIAPLGPMAPISKAGADQILNDSDSDNFAIASLDGTASVDADGEVVAYEWREGTTIIGNTSVITANLSVGVHTITLSVTDNDGLVGTDDVRIEVIQDVSGPVISSVSTASGISTATITWNTNENASSLVRYGTTVPNLEKSNSTLVSSHEILLTGLLPGTSYFFEIHSTDGYGNKTVDTNNGSYYTFTTDNESLSKVGDIALTFSTQTKGKNKFCTVTSLVNVTDQTGNPLSGATVQATWSGKYSSNVSGITDANGKIVFETSSVKGCGSFTFTVNDISKSGYRYDPSINNETSATIITS